MSLLHVFILALIQGLTEFLPVSSSAHLIFPSHLLGWEDQGIAFDVAVHVGTLLAVVLYYLADIVKISTFTIEAVVKRKVSPIAKIGFCVIIGTLPVVIVGGLFEKTISTVIRDSIDVIPLAFAHDKQGSAIHIGDAVKFSRKDNQYYINKGNSESKFFDKKFKNFYKDKDEILLTDNGQPISTDEVVPFISGVLSENLNCCIKEAKNDLKHSSGKVFLI